MADYEKDAKERLSKPIHAERHVNIVVAGAGASGLLMAYKLQRHFQNYTLTIFEKNPELSGTWFENKYPG
jgi:cation diffusion facilitator CzcD-associated flavoprotein CzcO